MNSQGDAACSCCQMMSYMTGSKLLPPLIQLLGYVAFVPGSPPEFVNISRGQVHEGAPAEYFDNSLPRRPPNNCP